MRFSIPINILAILERSLSSQALVLTIKPEQPKDKIQREKILKIMNKIKLVLVKNTQ